MHNTSKVLMGCPLSSEHTTVSHVGEIAAGTVVRRKSDGTITTVAADGDLYGVSLGKDLSKAGYSSICVAGLGIPVLITAAFDPSIGAVVRISDTTGFGVTSGGAATAATYAQGRVGGTGVNGGVNEDGASVGAAVIDFPGGL